MVASKQKQPLSLILIMACLEKKNGGKNVCGGLLLSHKLGTCQTSDQRLLILTWDQMNLLGFTKC